MSHQLSSPHHSFDIALAAKYSMEEAVLIHHFQHWIGVNRRLKQNFHEGRYWTYQTITWMAAHFPYWSAKQVERLLNKLVKAKILIKSNFNKSGFDRTVWYTLQDREIDIPKSGNGDPEIGRPIPDTKPDTITIPSPNGEGSCAYRATPPQGKEEFQNQSVKMPKDRYDALVAKYGEQVVLRIIQRMNLYSESNPTAFRKYKSHAATVENWINRDQDQEQAIKAATKRPIMLAPQVDRTGRDEHGNPIITGKEGLF